MYALPSGQPICIAAAECGYCLSVPNPTPTPGSQAQALTLLHVFFDSKASDHLGTGQKGRLSISHTAEVPSVSEVAGLHAELPVEGALEAQKRGLLSPPSPLAH